MLKVFNELILIQHSEIAVVEALGKIPMEQRDERDDIIGKQLVDIFLIELDTRGVYGIVAAAEWDNSRPGDRESVSLSTIGFEECDVFLDAVVRVASNVAG